VNIDNITTANRRTASDLSLVNFESTDVAIAMGDTATGNQQVMMLDTAIEMMKKRFLEEGKDQGTPTPIVVGPGIVSSGNSHTFNGQWPGGTQIRVTTMITDLDGDVDEQVMVVTLPPAPSPPGYHPAPAAASVVTGEVNAQPHVTATLSGSTMTLAETAPSNVLTSLVEIV
jgi:hypothetical protein